MKKYRNTHGGFKSLKECEDYLHESQGLIQHEKTIHYSDNIKVYYLKSHNAPYKKLWMWIVEYNSKLKTWYIEPPTLEKVNFMRSDKFLREFHKYSE